MFRFALLAIALISSPADAQCQLCGSTPAGAGAKLAPLRIEVTTTLDLGRAAQTHGNGAGAITLDASGQRRVTGSLVDLGGTSLTGTVRLVGEPFAQVLITLPQRVTLYAADGRSADVTDIRTDKATLAALDALGALTLSFGGKVSVNGGDSGDFRGLIPITADYR